MLNGNTSSISKSKDSQFSNSEAKNSSRKNSSSSKTSEEESFVISLDDSGEIVEEVTIKKPIVRSSSRDSLDRGNIFDTLMNDIATNRSNLRTVTEIIHIDSDDEDDDNSGDKLLAETKKKLFPEIKVEPEENLGDKTENNGKLEENVRKDGKQTKLAEKVEGRAKSVEKPGDSNETAQKSEEKQNQRKGSDTKVEEDVRKQTKTTEEVEKRAKSVEKLGDTTKAARESEENQNQKSSDKKVEEDVTKQTKITEEVEKRAQSVEKLGDTTKEAEKSEDGQNQNKSSDQKVEETTAAVEKANEKGETSEKAEEKEMEIVKNTDGDVKAVETGGLGFKRVDESGDIIRISDGTEEKEEDVEKEKPDSPPNVEDATEPLEKEKEKSDGTQDQQAEIDDTPVFELESVPKTDEIPMVTDSVDYPITVGEDGTKYRIIKPVEQENPKEVDENIRDQDLPLMEVVQDDSARVSSIYKLPSYFSIKLDSLHHKRVLSSSG